MALYFPCSPDNKNNSIPQAVINYFMSHAIGNREYYVIYGAYQTSGLYQYFWGNAWTGDETGVLGDVGNQQQYNTATYFDFYKSTTPTDFVSFSVSYKTDNQRFYNFTTNTSIFVTSPMRCESDIYNLNVSFVSTVNLKDRDGNYLIKIPDEETPDGDIFEINNMWTHGIWLNDTQPQVNGRPNYRSFRGKMVSGKFALYPISGIDSGALKMGIKNDAEFYEMEYTTDGINWVSTDTFPFDFFYRKRNRELGEFDYALTFSNSKIPEFDDETTAQGYIDGDVDITQASNWTDISNEYPIINNTADSDDATTMGEVYTRAFFSQQYICSVNAIQQISNALFDITQGGITGMWENIKKGLEMYGEKPVDAIQGCMFFPIDLSQVYQSVSVLPYIYFGGYKFDLHDGVTVSKITYPNGSYDFGSFFVSPSFGGSWRDFAPYQRLYCYLPYIGWTELDIARYIGRTVNVKYYFDTRTGMCLACLFVQTDDGWLLNDYFNGQCGVSMPITLTDFTSYANAQIQTLLGVGNGQIQNMSNIGGMAHDLASKGVGASSIAMASASLGAVSVGIGATKALYGLTQNNINNFNKTKGGSSSMLNMCLPQEVMFMIETQDAKITPNELSLMGFPSNASGRLMDFSGYLEVDTVNLSCPYATENEKAEIIGLLKSGVYI